MKFFDDDVNRASQGLVSQHANQFTEQKVLQQVTKLHTTQ